jgi:hypothetical protein
VHRGFFLRAEDFFGFTKALAKLRADMLEDLARIEVEYKDRGLPRGGACTATRLNTLHEMERRYGIDLDENSHGQSFLKLFRSRFVPGGLYLLDEPEAPLSHKGQLALLMMIDDMGSTGRQFISARTRRSFSAFRTRRSILRRVRHRAGSLRGARPRGDHARVLNAPGRFLGISRAVGRSAVPFVGPRYSGVWLPGRSHLLENWELPD